jgi:hypothetical protein
MQQIINDLKKYDWNFITSFGNSLEQLNNKQLRFMKGFVCEELIASQDGTLDCLREDHKDFYWNKHKITMELKSQLSQSMYKQNGSLRKTFIVKFTNSNGTNNKDTLDPSLICDITLVLRNDGSFIVNRDTVVKNLVKTGDGFDLKLKSSDITEISGYVTDTTKYNVDLESVMVNSIREAINKGKACSTK